MKKITGILLVAFMFAFTAETLAQTLGVRAGLNMANVMMKDDDDTYSDEFKAKGGFLAGLTAEFPLSEAISFETGVIANVKGFKVDEEEAFAGESFSYNVTANPIYVDIPLTAKLYFDLGGARLFGKVGPYVGFGVAGNYKSEMTMGDESETETESIEWGGDDGDFERLDYGLLFGAGLDLGFIEAGASYGYGMANISTNDEGGFTAQNRVFSVFVGIKFGGR